MLFGTGFGVLLISLAFAYHCIRSGRPWWWLLVIGMLGPIGWAAYIIFAIVPDMFASTSARRFADNVAAMADPGRGYREKLREVERVGSADAKRALAEECIKRGLFQDAVELYQGAMQGPIGESDPVLLKGLARAKLLAGDGKGAADAFEKLKDLDRAAFDADTELDYARALALVGRTDEALRQYECVVPRYPGEEARCRYALLLQQIGQTDRAQALFREIVASVKHAPGYYRSRQREWVQIARQQLA
ncbi:hypothetical protein FHS83_000332 [Rhizomicrobium palustre]|uniref:Tetratricopeptide repeat protein n=1 Tax=Rhizomicrobium palustre TaxID=189966 RepID=A0A846MUA3_9PROT|nr:hypothetical protein [Rhizomicrobium palustre]NIK87014.1 hypothetical protein [Rhizomicrobium palustre]